MNNGAVVFRLSQSLKNLMVEAKLQCKRTSYIIIKCLDAGIMINAIAYDDSSAKSLHVIIVEQVGPSHSSHYSRHGLDTAAASDRVAILPALTFVATFSLCNIKCATRPISPSLHRFVAPLLALPPVLQVVLPLPQFVLDAFAKLTLERVDVEVVVVRHVLVDRRR